MFVGCAASDVADAPEDESISEIEEALTGYGLDGSDPNACVDGSTVTKATKDLVVSYLGYSVNEGKVSLKYSPTCKTFWAKVELTNPASGFARGEVVRFGNNKKTLTCNVPAGKTWCYTPQLYNDGSAFIGQIFLDVWNGSHVGDTSGSKIRKGDLTPSVTIAADVVDAGSILRVTATALNLREGPGTNYGKLQVLNQNEEVTVVERSGQDGWIHVKSSAGKTGWASAKYLTLVRTGSPEEGGHSGHPTTPTTPYCPINETSTILDLIATFGKEAVEKLFDKVMNKALGTPFGIPIPRPVFENIINNGCRIDEPIES
jgi:hypothetical protein